LPISNAVDLDPCTVISIDDGCIRFVGLEFHGSVWRV
jgi:hypothetical protein